VSHNHFCLVHPAPLNQPKATRNPPSAAAQSDAHLSPQRRKLAPPAANQSPGHRRDLVRGSSAESRAGGEWGDGDGNLVKQRTRGPTFKAPSSAPRPTTGRRSEKYLVRGMKSGIAPELRQQLVRIGAQGVGVDRSRRPTPTGEAGHAPGAGPRGSPGPGESKGVR